MKRFDGLLDRYLEQYEAQGWVPESVANTRRELSRWGQWLKELDLDETGITDAGLTHLKGLKNLRKLGIRRTQVTSEGVADLQKALPTCEIYQ
ncbi:MAG: hypothetical protein N2C14_30440 [Planctomycetales bacterium]